jgi:CubicO group peptidase (beta-lactamase class C family)
LDLNNLDIEKIIDKINKVKPFSGVVLVQQNDKIIFQRAYEFANRSEEIANTMDTRFGIASGCKIFTAIAICQLVEKGLLSFNSLLRECLSTSFSEFDQNICIHHLLTHSSGIPDYFDEDTMTDYSALWNDIPMYRMKNPKDFISMFASQKMKFSPGDKFQYNNAGFILLGLIIEQQTGMHFTEYVEKNIFLPCGMDDSGYFSLDKLPKNVAYGYIKNELDGSWKTNIYSIPIIGGPDGGAFITAPDMIRFWKSLLGYKLLSKDYVQKLTTDYISAGDDEYYGYGIWINKRENEIFKYHAMGGDPGVCFRSAVYPQNDIQIVVIGNKEYGAYAITKEIENIILLQN